MIRNNIFDCMKGIAIFLVVLGHAIPDATSLNGISSELMRVLHSIIYSFHMPVFFFVAGYFSKFIGDNLVDNIVRRCKRLLLPYFFVGTIYFPFKLLLSQFANKPIEVLDILKMPLGVNPDGELWFLYVLFFITIVVGIVIKHIHSIHLVISLIIYIIASIFIEVSVIRSLLLYQLYFTLGRYIHEKGLLDIFSFSIIKVLSVGLIFITSNIWLIVNHEVMMFPSLAAALSGIYLTYLTSICWSKYSEKLYTVLVFLGCLSMEIYILSDIIKIPLRIILYSKLHLYYTTIIVCTIAPILLSILVSKWIKKSNLLSLLFFGISKS